MLSLWDYDSRVGRRTFLQAGHFALGGLGLGSLLSSRAGRFGSSQFIGAEGSLRDLSVSAWRSQPD